MTEVALVRDPMDAIASSGPVGRAVERLRRALHDRGIHVIEVTATPQPVEGDVGVVSISGSAAPGTLQALSLAGVSVPARPEAFAIVSENDPRDRLTACGADVRGLVYAVLEIVDRVEHGADPPEALRFGQPLVEGPANAVRSVARLFCSEVEDLSWYRDEEFWRRYLAMLVSQRFNRFSLTLGLGYNFPRGVTDAYLYFAYPFLLSVPGYEVRVPQLPDEERERNLAALRFVSEESEALGLDFQLGLWTHAYKWIESPDAHQTVEGLTPDIHAAYCRDAVRMLMEECPAITGVTFRIHGEGGVPEGSWDFWQTVFEGVAGCSRLVGIDLHAKGLDERTLDCALDTGLPITVSPKFWAEHMGLPYHQAAIRESERLPREDPSDLSEWHRYMRVSEGSRPFTRYGYADFLREDRPYDVVFRLWAGTQRLLLWGDPAFAAGYGRAAGLAGSRGLEWCEPLTFKGREGSGVPGSRTGYADSSLVPPEDWQKYGYTYRLFGRLTYDPNAPAEVWRRALRMDFGSAALHAEAALASASRILPLVTVAHHPSASNNYYWPELYTDMPIVAREDVQQSRPYADTPAPRRFGTVSPLDPEVFSSVADFVEELLASRPSGRISPLEVARRLDDLAEDALRHLGELEERISNPDAEVRRWSADIAILAGLGRFFAGKLRSSVYYELYVGKGNHVALRRAVETYVAARRAWLSASSRADDVYVHDLTFGPQQRLRGHWADRVEAIDADLRDMEDQLRAVGGRRDDEDPVRWFFDETARHHPDVDVLHVPPAYRLGESLTLEVGLQGRDAAGVRAVTVRYRPMNHMLSYAALDMEPSGRGFAARIPGGELDGAHPIAYAFNLVDVHGIAWRHPSVGVDLAQQPYYVLRPEG